MFRYNAQKLKILLDESRQLLKKKSYSKAVSLNHHIIANSHHQPDSKLLALELMAEACDKNNQPFFGAEYFRCAEDMCKYAENIYNPSNVNLQIKTKCKSSQPELVNKCRKDFTYLTTKMSHKVGLPTVPGLDNIYHQIGNLKPEGYINCMTWGTDLIVGIKNENEDPRNFYLLITAFDFNFGEQVIGQFLRNIEIDKMYKSQLNDGHPMPNRLRIISHSISDHFGLLLRIPSDEYNLVTNFGNEILKHPFPPSECPGYPLEPTSENFFDAGEQAENKGAYLYSRTFFLEAALIFHEENKLIQYDKSLTKLNTISKLLNLEENANELFERARIARKPRKSPIRDHHFQIAYLDEPSGKILGRQRAEVARHEKEISQMLIKAWEIEFPKKVPPFKMILSYFEYSAQVISIQNPKNIEIMRLATTVWAGADTSRLEYSQFILSKTSENHLERITQFSQNVGRGIRVMHKYLRGSFTSQFGSSISPGNLSVIGLINDYETVLIPNNELPQSLKKYQLTDILNAIRAIVFYAYLCEKVYLVQDGIETFYLSYTGLENLPKTRQNTNFRTLLRSYDEFRMLVKELRKSLN